MGCQGRPDVSGNAHGSPMNRHSPRARYGAILARSFFGGLRLSAASASSLTPRRNSSWRQSNA